ncbi:MAG: radical SAM protein [Planctomycetota bacterium]
MSFLDEVRRVTESIRAGAIPSPREIQALKVENRRLADEGEREQVEWCDFLPVWLNMTNSTVCNLRCTFCNQAYGKGVDWRMEEPIYRQIVTELYPFLETVQLTAYGEPMMTPNLYGKMADMERFGVKMELVTNATLMKGQKLLARMARVLGLLTVSIDGATRETYESLRIGARFDEVIQNVRNFNEERGKLPENGRPPLHFNYIIMKKTIAELPLFLELAKELEGQHVTVMHMVVFEDALRDQSLDDSRALANHYLLEAGRTARRLDLSVNLPPLYPLAAEGERGTPRVVRDTRPDSCYFLWKRVYIGPTGDVIPCCLSGIHRNGNMVGSSIASVWNNDLYREMRRRVHSDDPYGLCKHCYLINRRTDMGGFDRREKSAPNA